MVKKTNMSMKGFEKTINDHSITSLLVIIVVVFLGGFLLNWFMGGSLYEGNSNMGNKLTYYYMEGCGHCNNFNPIWDEFTSGYSGPPEVTFEKIESKNAPSSVKGFPTVVLTKADGSTSEFNADRTVGELQNFISNQEVS
tara:strand:+ start:328 stop:747 length:420 start_codon:yes stop_codon:yes gene_type:complete